MYCVEEAVDKFLECLEEQKYIQEKLDFVEPIQLERRAGVSEF